MEMSDSQMREVLNAIIDHKDEWLNLHSKDGKALRQAAKVMLKRLDKRTAKATEKVAAS
jgi:hypothetical protein